MQRAVQAAEGYAAALARRLGVYDQARRLGGIIDPAIKRDRADNRHLRLLIAFTLSEDSNCIDVGAHRGEVLSEMVRAAPHGRHIAYEPLPHLAADLARRFADVEVRCAALSNHEGEADFNFVKNLPSQSGLAERTYPIRPQIEKIRVRLEALDRSLPGNYIPALIKIDVEGAERLVLEGALETLKRWKPLVIFEHGRAAATAYDTQPSQVYALLHDEAQLRIFDLDGNGPYSMGQFEETYFKGDRWNFVAHS